MNCVIITGGTKGIGLALVNEYAKHGWAVITCARRVEGFVASLPADWQNRVIALAADMSSTDAVKQFASEALAQCELQGWSLKVLVNNAGVFIPGQVHTEDEGLLEHQLNTNLLSAYHMTRAILPTMLPNATGHIVNMCSIASFMAYPNGGSYSISKWALLGFTKVLRAELLTKGIKVTAVMPGATLTPSWDGVDLPAERLMPAEEIAEAVWNATNTSGRTVVEEIVLRPQLGDL